MATLSAGTWSYCLTVVMSLSSLLKTLADQELSSQLEQARHWSPLAASNSQALVQARQQQVTLPLTSMRLISENLVRMRSSAMHSKRCLEEMAQQLGNEIGTCDDCVALVRNLIRESGHSA